MRRRGAARAGAAHRHAGAVRRAVRRCCEFAIPYALWTAPEPPTFFGESFYPEDEFGVYALHAWVWRNNPNGMFEESNPRVTCGAE